MYNRYINPSGFDDVKRESSAAPEPEFADITPEEEDEVPTKSKLAGLFGGNFKLPNFDADTILMLVLVYFLISDEIDASKEGEDGKPEKKNISDTLLIIGALLLLGF